MPKITEADAIEVWLHTEVAAAYDKIKAGTSKGLTSDQLRASLNKVRAKRAHANRSSDKQAQKLLLVLHVLNAAKEIFGEDELPFDWLVKIPLPVFHQKTAWEMIEAGRTEDVLQYLKSYSAGFVG